jgi:glycine dehydrogenase subunit 2
MRDIAREASETPDVVKDAPHNTPVIHPDDTEAALHPIVTYRELQAK